MGSYPNTYIGCYIQFDHKTYQTGETIITYETESGEVFKEKVNFSPVTGEEAFKCVKEIKKSETLKHLTQILDDLPGEADDYMDNYFEVSEYVSPKGKTVLISNNSNSKFLYRIEQDEIREIDFYIDNAIDEFKQQHGKFINDLKRFFDNVEVKLGVVNYSN